MEKLTYKLPSLGAVNYYFEKWKRDGTIQRVNDALNQKDRVNSGNNIKNLAPIIKMYATQKLITPNLNYSSFRTLLNDYINRCNELQKITLDGVLNKIKAELPDYQEVPEKVIESKIDGTQSKVDIYEHFKAVNDKWIAGSDFKSKTIFEDMLFLDRASRNIGETLFLDIFSNLRITLVCS